MLLQVSHIASFISIQFFVLSLDDWVTSLSKRLFFFNIPFYLYMHINLSSSMGSFIFSRVIYFSFDILVIRNYLANQITNCFCCFLNCSFWTIFNCVYSRFFSMFKNCWPYLILKFSPIFLPIFLPIAFIMHHFLHVTHRLITKIIFILLLSLTV